MTPLELTNALRSLEGRVKKMEGARNGPFPFEHLNIQFERLEKKIEVQNDTIALLRREIARLEKARIRGKV